MIIEEPPPCAGLPQAQRSACPKPLSRSFRATVRLWARRMARSTLALENISASRSVATIAFPAVWIGSIPEQRSVWARIPRLQAGSGSLNFPSHTTNCCTGWTLSHANSDQVAAGGGGTGPISRALSPFLLNCAFASSSEGTRLSSRGQSSSASRFNTGTSGRKAMLCGVASREGRGNKEIPRPASLAIGAFPGGV